MASLDILAQRNSLAIETINDNLNNNIPNLFLSPESVKYYSSKQSESITGESSSSSLEPNLGSSYRRKYRPTKATVSLDVFINSQKQDNKPTTIIDKLINKNKLALTSDSKMKQDKNKTKLQNCGSKGRTKGKTTGKRCQRNNDKKQTDKSLVNKNLVDDSKKTPNDKIKRRGRGKGKKEAEISKPSLVGNTSQDKQTLTRKNTPQSVNKRIRNVSISNIDIKSSPNKIINGDVLSNPAYVTRSSLNVTELRNGKKRKCNENDAKSKQDLKKRKLNNDGTITKTNITVVRRKRKGKRGYIQYNRKTEVKVAVEDDDSATKQDEVKRVKNEDAKKKKETQIKTENFDSALIPNIPFDEIENPGKNLPNPKIEALNDSTDVYRHSVEGNSASPFENNLSNCDTNFQNFYPKTNNITPSIPSEDSIEEDIPIEKMIIPRRSRISDFNESIVVDKSSDTSLDSSSDHQLENTSEKEKFLRSLGLQPVNESYTGTLKAVIKLHRSSSNEKGYRRMEMRLSNSQDNQPQSYSRRKYDVSDLANIPLTHLNSVMNSEYYSYKDGENGSGENFVNLSCTEVNNDGRFADFNMSIDNQLGDVMSKGTLCKEKSKSNSSLIVPEKSSSFSIHPNRLCYDVCKYCFGKFGSLDTPCHVAQLKNPESQKRILNSEPNLKLDTCLCDACYRHVDRKANKPSENRKGISRFARRFVKCAVESCGQAARKMIKRKLLLKLRRRVHGISFQLTKSNPRSLYGLCHHHFYMMDIYTACGICKKRLDRNHMFGIESEVSILNTALSNDGIPVRLTQSRMLCKVCHYHTSIRLKYYDSSYMPHSHREYYESFKNKILCSYGLYPGSDNDDRKAEDTSGRSEDDANDIITIDTEEDEREENKATSSKVKSFKKGKKKPKRNNNVNSEEFSDITSFLKSRGEGGSNDKKRDSARKIEVRFGDLNIGKVGNLNIGQDARTTESKPMDPSMEIPILADFKFETASNWGQNKNLEKCVSTILFDKSSKKLWHELQKPYGNQSSFVRHLIMLEKYWRSGSLVLAENADPASVKYINSVQNRVQSLENTTAFGSNNNAPLSNLTTFKPKEDNIDLTNMDSIKNVITTGLNNDKRFKSEKGFTNICDLSSKSKNGFQNICDLTTLENNNDKGKSKNGGKMIYYDALGSKGKTNFNKNTSSSSASTAEAKMIYYDTSNSSSSSSSMSSSSNSTGFKNIFDLPQYEGGNYTKKSSNESSSSTMTTSFKIINDKSSTKIMECKNATMMMMRNGSSNNVVDLGKGSSKNLDLSKNTTMVNGGGDLSKMNLGNKIDAYKNILVSPKVGGDSSKNSRFNDKLRIKISPKIATDTMKNPNNIEIGSSSNNVEISSKNNNDVTSSSRGRMILNEASSNRLSKGRKSSSSMTASNQANSKYIETPERNGPPILSSNSKYVEIPERNGPSMTSSNSKCVETPERNRSSMTSSNLNYSRPSPPEPDRPSSNQANSKYFVTPEANKPSSNLNASKYVTVSPEPTRPAQSKSEHNKQGPPSLIKLSHIPQQFSILKTPSTYALQSTTQSKTILGKSILCKPQVTSSLNNRRQTQVKNFIPITFHNTDNMNQVMKIRQQSTGQVGQVGGKPSSSTVTGTVTSVTQTSSNSIFTPEMGDISIINKIPRSLSITSLDEYISTKTPIVEETPSVSLYREGN